MRGEGGGAWRFERGKETLIAPTCYEYSLYIMVCHTIVCIYVRACMALCLSSLQTGLRQHKTSLLSFCSRGGRRGTSRRDAWQGVRLFLSFFLGGWFPVMASSKHLYRPKIGRHGVGIVTPYASTLGGMAHPGPLKWKNPPLEKTVEKTVVLRGSARCVVRFSSGPLPVACVWTIKPRKESIARRPFLISLSLSSSRLPLEKLSGSKMPPADTSVSQAAATTRLQSSLVLE